MKETQTRVSDEPREVGIIQDRNADIASSDDLPIWEDFNRMRLFDWRTK
jgi:hypothetical protein